MSACQVQTEEQKNPPVKLSKVYLIVPCLISTQTAVQQSFIGS